MSYEIVTVVTKSSGMFDDLVNNEFDKNIVVLGMGQKWTGFKMKYELVYDYIKNKDDEDIIIFLDGFDSEIKRDPDIAYKIFNEKNYKMVVSKEPLTDTCLYKFGVKVFGICRDGLTANSGMYMGKVKYLKEYLKHSLSKVCKDDQRILNNSCSQFDFIEVDEQEEIFQNVIKSYVSSPPYNNKAVFVSYPGTPSIERNSRSIFSYPQFFLKEIIFIYLILLALILFFGKNKDSKFIWILFITLFLVIWLVNIDYSCV